MAYMTNQEYIQRIHSELLDIMDIIHAICVNRHIRYYLTAGTLLGAVRHGGFIPWDDDLDIAMPREDYDRFLAACKTDLSVDYEAKDILTDNIYSKSFVKVCKKGTLFLERVRRGFDMGTGIFVDIFPLDDTSGATKEVSLRKALLAKVNSCILAKEHLEYYRWFERVVARLLPRRFLVKLQHSLMCMSNDKGKLYYTNFSSQYPISHKTQLKTVYGNGTPISFEGRQYMAPEDYKTDLISNFGPKYMELPPVEKRRTHYPVKVIFSDGAVFVPQNTNENKVSVAESIDW